MRPIDADAVLKKLLRMRNHCRENGLEYEMSALFQAVDVVIDCPTLSYKDLVPQGEWIDCRGGDATCSRCGIRQKAVYDDDNEQHFCGHCGARMTK